LDDADDPDIHQAPDVRRSIQKDHDVEWIAVVSERGGDKTEIERKHHSLGQQAAQFEQFGSGVVVEFVPETLRRLDDRPALTVLWVKLVGKGSQISHYWQGVYYGARDQSNHAPG